MLRTYRECLQACTKWQIETINTTANSLKLFPCSTTTNNQNEQPNVITKSKETHFLW